jgi:hypothetical protein
VVLVRFRKALLNCGFNAAIFANSLKWIYYNEAQAEKGVELLRACKIDYRGHAILRPSFERASARAWREMLEPYQADLLQRREARVSSMQPVFNAYAARFTERKQPLTRLAGPRRMLRPCTCATKRWRSQNSKASLRMAISMKVRSVATNGYCQQDLLGTWRRRDPNDRRQDIHCRRDPGPRRRVRVRGDALLAGLGVVADDRAASPGEPAAWQFSIRGMLECSCPHRHAGRLLDGEI